MALAEIYESSLKILLLHLGFPCCRKLESHKPLLTSSSSSHRLTVTTTLLVCVKSFEFKLFTQWFRIKRSRDYITNHLLLMELFGCFFIRNSIPEHRRICMKINTDLNHETFVTKGARLPERCDEMSRLERREEVADEAARLSGRFSFKPLEVVKVQCLVLVFAHLVNVT